MTHSALHIEPIPAFTDNYIWLLHRGASACAVVDPGDAAPVMAELARRGLELEAILLTHHHWDHAGGVPELLEAWPQAQVFGPRDERLGAWNQPQKEGDLVTIPQLDLEFSVIDVPAHTSSHIAFHGHGALFSGDTLFSVGCGRLFEGTPKDMQRALDKLAQLPGDTRIYCGHEYTRDNCRFALAVEPENKRLQARAEAVEALRQTGKPSLPARLADELETNPFLRTRAPAVVAAARVHEPDASPGVSTMRVIRAWKDRF